MKNNDRRTPKGPPSAVTVACALGATVGLATQVLAQAPIIQPGAPGEPSRQITAQEAVDLAGIQYSDADVKFMQGMITHHAQALDMTALIDDRAARDVMRLLGQRIALSQEDEIGMMQGWLRDRGLEVPDAAAHHMHGESEEDLMPGMATSEQMAALAAAAGPAFDALFLELMIEHHRGALTMVNDLLEQPGSAQDSVLYDFTADITADQSAEIERMDAMLAGFSPDPRVALKPGFLDADQASLNMRLVVALPKPAGFFDPEHPAGRRMERQPPGLENAEELMEEFEDLDERREAGGENADEGGEDERAEPRPSLLNFANTDLVFAGDALVAGNYHGFNIYGLTDPRAPALLSSVVCPGGQGDVSIVGHLLIYSVEQTRGRVDCGLQGVAEPSSDARFRGIRIFDVSDLRAPRQVAAVQTCRGSHTHTVVTDPDDDGNFYVYGAGTARVRPGEELDGCSDDSPFENPETALFRIDVIQVPVGNPENARIVNRPFVFSDPESGVIAGLWEGGDHGPGTQDTRETNQCHDITAFAELGLAAGACSGNGILLDISDPVNPMRVHEVIDTGFAYWHSATFNNDGTKVIFTDEWGGGSRPRCRASDPRNWGADAIYDIVEGKLEFRGYYKLPVPQTEQENCVAHNGSLIPVPGRDIFVQAWYQGGLSVMDFTDSANAIEIAYFDRGPLDAEELILGGYWSTYWYDGLIYGTEIARGLDVLALTPSDYLSANEIAAAALGQPDVVNPQQQRRWVWPAEPVVAKAYVDQLLRSEVLEPARAATLTAVLDRTESLLARGARDAATVAELEELSVALLPADDGLSDRTRGRLVALATTVGALAGRLR
jgi:uncharacterized protein (DUF305 family)